MAVVCGLVSILMIVSGTNLSVVHAQAYCFIPLEEA